MAGCVVAGTVRKAPPAQARWILSNRSFPPGQAPAVQKVGTACAQKTTSRAWETAKSAAAFRGLVVSPLFFSVTSQHNIPHTSLDSGGDYIDLLHLRPREAWWRSTPSPAEGGAAEVYSIFGRGRRGGGLLQLRAYPPNLRRRSQMPQVHHHALRLTVAISVDLADPHCRSISLGRPDEPDPPGNITNCCDSGLYPPPPQKSSHARSVLRRELWSDASTRSREDCQSELDLQQEWCWGCSDA
jgi:hypothetical protein